MFYIKNIMSQLLILVFRVWTVNRFNLLFTLEWKQIEWIKISKVNTYS